MFISYQITVTQRTPAQTSMTIVLEILSFIINDGE